MSPELTFFVANRKDGGSVICPFVEWEVVTCLILVMCKMVIVMPGSARGLWETEDINVIRVQSVHVKWGVASLR